MVLLEGFVKLMSHAACNIVLMQHDLRCLYGDMLHDISIMQRCRHVRIQKSTEMGKIDI